MMDAASELSFFPLFFDFLLAGLALLVFVGDLLLPSGQKRGLGAVSAAGLAGILALTFLVDAHGTAFSGAYATDELALYLKRIFYVAGILAALGGLDWAERAMPARHGEYQLLLLLSLLGMSLLAGARELVFLAVSFELMGMPLYALAGLARGGRREAEATLKFYLVGAASSAFALYGMALLYGAAGTTEIAGLAAATTAAPLVRVGLMAVVAGMGFKLGMVPFHFWIPDTYDGVPTPFVAFLSTAPKAAGFAALLRLFQGGLMQAYPLWGGALLFLAGLGMVVGNLYALPQERPKRLLAGSGIAHVGILLLAFGVGTERGIAMLLFYLLAYVFTNMGVFLLLAHVEASLGDESGGLDLFRGLARRAPGTSLGLLVGLLSLGGIPFVAGFWAKFYVYMAAWEAGQGWLVFLAAALAVLALFYYLRLVHAMYMREPEDPTPLPSPSRALGLTVILALLGVVGMGLYPRPFVDGALAAARDFASPAATAQLDR